MSTTTRERMIRETETFLERELNRDTIPCQALHEEEDAFFFVVEPEQQTWMTKVS